MLAVPALGEMMSAWEAQLLGSVAWLLWEADRMWLREAPVLVLEG